MGDVWTDSFKFNYSFAMDTAHLLDLLTTYFDDDELKTLCFGLGIDYANLAAENKNGKARELIAYATRHAKIEGLTSAIISARPNLRIFESGDVAQHDLNQGGLQKRIAYRPPATTFFCRLPIFDDLIQESSQIDLCGVFLTSTINRQLNNIRESMSRGARVRVMVADPDSNALAMASERSEEQNLEYHKTKLQASLHDLSYLCRYQSKLGPSARGSIEVHLLSFAPSFAIYSFDAHKPTGRLLVEMYPHIVGWGNTPVFDLTPTRDDKWHAYFYEQFEQMWRRAVSWTHRS